MKHFLKMNPLPGPLIYINVFFIEDLHMHLQLNTS